MSTNSLHIGLEFSATEVLDQSDYPAGESPGNRTLTASGFNTQDDIDSSTTPAIEKAAATMEVTIGATPTVIDLTAVDIAVGRTEDMTGKKLIAYVFNAAGGNAGSITVDAHSTSGYNIFGASGLLVLVPGRRIASTIYGVASGEVAVGASAKNIRVSGTQGDVIKIGLAFGT